MLGSVSKAKNKPDKPYQSETYRVMNNASSQSANQTQQSSIVQQSQQASLASIVPDYGTKAPTGSGQTP